MWRTVDWIKPFQELEIVSLSSGWEVYANFMTLCCFSHQTCKRPQWWVVAALSELTVPKHVHNPFVICMLEMENWDKGNWKCHSEMQIADDCNQGLNQIVCDKIDLVQDHQPFTDKYYFESTGFTSHVDKKTKHGSWLTVCSRFCIQVNIPWIAQKTSPNPEGFGSVKLLGRISHLNLLPSFQLRLLTL